MKTPMTGLFWPTLQSWLADAWTTLHPHVPLTGQWQPCPVPGADLTHSGALVGAKTLKQPPAPLAHAWVAALPSHPWVEAVAVVGPGHVNLTLSAQGQLAALGQALQAPLVAPALPAESWLVEFVSANPTGPLHIGHARQAVLGDVLVRLLAHQGHRVAREFYVNDAGGQIVHLVHSLGLRLAELTQAVTLVFERDLPQDEDGQPIMPVLAAHERLFPKTGYHGTYVVDLAKAWLTYRAAPQTTHPLDLKAWAVQTLLAEQQADLLALGVAPFDAFVSEQALHDHGQVAAVIAALLPHAHQADNGAWVLPTTAFGDDKDRVMLRADGRPTYFVPDVAYHFQKWQRGYTHALNIQGSDHIGTLLRLKAGLQLMDPGIPIDYPQVLLHTMVKVMHQGVEVATSKRAGGYLTVHDLVGLIGADALRVLLLQTQPQSPAVVDIDVALSSSADNPLYTIQYAHARACAVLEALGHPSAVAAWPAQVPWAPAEVALWQLLLMWPWAVHKAGQDRAPHQLAHQTRALASAYHQAYQGGPKLKHLSGVDLHARVALTYALRHALREGCALLGVHAPVRMPLPEP